MARLNYGAATLGVVFMRMSQYKIGGGDRQSSAPRTFNQPKPMSCRNTTPGKPTVNSDNIQIRIMRHCVFMNGLSIRPMGQQSYDGVIAHRVHNDDHFGHLSSVPKW